MSEIPFGKIMADHIIFHLFQNSAAKIQIQKSKYVYIDSKRTEITENDCQQTHGYSFLAKKPPGIPNPLTVNRKPQNVNANLYV